MKNRLYKRSTYAQGFRPRTAFSLRKYKLALLAAVWLASGMTVIVGLPWILVQQQERLEPSGTTSNQTTNVPKTAKPTTLEPTVPVYLTEQKKIAELPLETYIEGVVAAEMPVAFEMEALKAQAIAARTYIVRRVRAGDHSGVPVKEAIVTDKVNHQAYKTDEDLRRQWGLAYERNQEKIRQAVEETAGEIILYKGQPIHALYFSTSNGYTENAEDYWGAPVAYLKSVPSPWDTAISPKYKETVVMDYRTFLRKLGIGNVSALSTKSPFIRVLERTEGRRIAKIRIGSQILTGKEVREKLDLRSSQFIWTIKGTQIEITTFGYGHGVGMSQWGANGLAKMGKSANEILTTYYSGVEIRSL
ncbi:hypothetical protein SY83_10815 [Paenibacillus swuensis]|uniref:Sporulation stage II protein D amidase enhancer LytB N-terminal domain-containing protein n=1 Tax=Paenibacillus swuensis TaxID=1178515 RepID=A0A172TI16_9BACL|nr:stage II sporulation protein D [Paenibacillus swuensis]ANE46681.1 hypothetical protein SY83_10815 [Paenibacillus swuensis]